VSGEGKYIRTTIPFLKAFGVRIRKLILEDSVLFLVDISGIICLLTIHILDKNGVFMCTYKISNSMLFLAYFIIYMNFNIIIKKDLWGVLNYGYSSKEN